jgi:hypothetical protein
MKRFSILLIITFLFLPSSAFGYLTQNDELSLTHDLETLSSGRSDAAISSANVVFFNSNYNADDWETYFNKFFNCSPSCTSHSQIEHSFTTALFNYLVDSAIFNTVADPRNINLQTGLINPLWNKIRNITSAHPADLGMAMFNNASLRQSLFNAHRFLEVVVEKGAVGTAMRSIIFFNYKIYIKTYPQYFSDTTTIDFFAQPFVGYLRAQVWMSFRESLPLTPALVREIATTIGLGQAGRESARKLDIWSNISTNPIFVDNNGLDSTQLNIIYDILAAIPPGIHNIKYYTVDYFLGQAGWRVVMNKGDTVNYNLTIRPDNQAQFSFHNTKGQFESFTTQHPLEPDTWNHVAVTFDGNKVTMYVNGLPDATGSSLGLPNADSSQSLELGRGGGLWMRGKLDEVKIYGRALSATEINDEYKNQPASAEKLVAYYKMDETMGPIVRDSSGFGNTGTNVGAAIIPGKANNGLFFNGKDAYMYAPDKPALKLNGSMTLEAWVYFVDESEWIRLLLPPVGNISGSKFGEGSENPFPSDISGYSVDTFFEVAVHEFNHAVSYFSTMADPNVMDRYNQLIKQAGKEPLQYLRSMFVNPDGTSVFPQGPQEFFASISNQYLADSWHTFDLAIQRFDKGYREPLNQFLFFADIYSKGGQTTKIFKFNKKGVLTVNNAPIYRDAFGHISKITRPSTNTVYYFKLDIDGNVTTYLPVPDTAHNITAPLAKNASIRK